MSMKKPLAAAVLAVAVVVTASPAWAHEEISPPTVQTGKPTFLTLTAANERSAALTRITLVAAAGTPFGEATRAPTGWTANASKDTITWSGGSVAHGAFESWGFEIEGADQPGTLSYKVTLGFADGKSENVTVPVTGVAAGTTATTISSGGGDSTNTTAAGTGAAASKAKKKSTTSSRRANVALGLGAAALALSVIALVSSRRRSSTGSTEERDW
jgi:opacity protein-like surface antigen